MIAIQSWVNRLFNRCAKTDTKNTYTATQTFSKEIISKSDKDVHTEPSASNTGVTNVITFLDSKDTVLGNVECFRTNTDSIGLRLRLKDHYLGFKLSDEGIITSFVDHPFKPGPDTQIATVKYVTDSYDEIFNLFKELQATVRDQLDKINNLDDLLNTINSALINIDSLPTKDSKNLVYSGGVYSYVTDALESFKGIFTEYIDKYLEEHKVFDITDNQAGFAPKVGMIRQCFINNDGASKPTVNDSKTLIFRAGDTVSGKHLFLGNYWFQADGEDAQYSFVQRMSGSDSFFKAYLGGKLTDSSWSIDSTKYNSTWVALSPVRSSGDYACSSGLFMCISVFKLGD